MISGTHNGKTILLLQDCKESEAKQCQKHETQVYKGDADRLARILAKYNFAEIWLSSNGGNLMEGVEIGKVFRKNRQFVRVPEGGRCVSSCTVAFLGGILRAVDRGATYEVHAYSRAEKDFTGMEVDTELKLEKWARHHAEYGRMWASILMPYFQRMLNGEPNEQAIQRATLGNPVKPIPYLKDGRVHRDLDRIQSGKLVAMEEIWMEMERESMELAIDDLKAVQNTLGRRASAAIQILEIMFTSRITSTAILSEYTLRQMGFVNVSGE